MYFIAPATSGLADQCNIVFREGFDHEGNALTDYRNNPNSWKTVGHINGQGKLVALDASVWIFNALKTFEPLMAGTCFRKHDLEVQAFAADLLHSHPAKKILLDQPAGTPFTMMHKDLAGTSHLTYCTITESKSVKTEDGDYQIDILMHHPSQAETTPYKLSISSDGSCKLLLDGQHHLAARPLLVGHDSCLTKDETQDEKGTALNQKMGRIWWVANDENELMSELDRLSRAGAHVCSVEREDDRNVIHYSFVLNKMDAKAIMLYQPDFEEWLEHDEPGILPFLEKSLDQNWVGEEKKVTDDTLAQLRAISLPGGSPEEYQLGLRILLQAAEPLVMKGTIEAVKGKVKKALSLPIDGANECSELHFWAIRSSWTYIHWDSPTKPIPADRQLMMELFEQMSELGPHPFNRPKALQPRP